MRTWPVTALAALALAACGGSGGQGPDGAAIRTAVQRWSDAVVGHDSPAACDQLSRRLRKTMARHILGEGAGGSCHTWAARYVSPRHPASHRDARITVVRIHGEHATVSLTAPGGLAGTASLVDENGRWRIDNY